jgi:hypothetical protein
MRGLLMIACLVGCDDGGNDPIVLGDARLSDALTGDAGPVDDAGAAPFDDTPAAVLSGLPSVAYSCYSNPAGEANQFVADVGFLDDGGLAVQTLDGMFTGEYTVQDTQLRLMVPALGFDETSVDGDIRAGVLANFQTPSLYCHVVALDFAQSDAEDGFRCPEINHDVVAGYYEWNRFYFASPAHGGVRREALYEFTQVPDTQIARRAGVYRQVGETTYLVFGAQGGDDVVLLTGRSAGDGVIIDQLDPSAGACMPLE